jgi:hypothetical protein
MVLTAKEYHVSRGVTKETGRETGTRVFNVYEAISPFEALSATGVSDNDLFPGSAVLFQNGYNIEKVEGHSDFYRVTHHYESAGEPTGFSSSEPQFEMSYETTFIEAWRVPRPGLPLVFPANGQPSSNHDDIGGSPEDSAGEPVSAKITSVIFDSLQVINGTPNWSLIETMAATRNSAPFLGIGTGKVLYVPNRSYPQSGNKYFVQHRFIAHPWFHMIQKPIMDIDRKVALGVGSFTLPSGEDVLVGHADAVYWVQPFPDLSDFNALGAFS